MNLVPYVKGNFVRRYCVSPVRYRNSEFQLRIRCYIICREYEDGKVYLLSKTKSYDLDPIFFESLESLESYIISKGWY